MEAPMQAGSYSPHGYGGGSRGCAVLCDAIRGRTPTPEDPMKMLTAVPDKDAGHLDQAEVVGGLLLVAHRIARHFDSHPNVRSTTHRLAGWRFFLAL